MDLGIAGKVALVTGASKGLGFGVAKALAEEGATVAVSSRSEERIQAAALAIGGIGFVHDSSDVDGAPVLADRVETELGPIKILVINTGGPPGGDDALAFRREEWEEAYRTLVLTPMALIRHVLPGMRDRGWGRILSLSSSAVREPIRNLMLSNTHRAAMLTGFKTIARQVARDGVTLNTLLPGRFATDRMVSLYASQQEADERAAEEIPAGRLGRVEEYASAAAFLCSEPASYITGVALLVDGGLTRSV